MFRRVLKDLYQRALKQRKRGFRQKIIEASKRYDLRRDEQNLYALYGDRILDSEVIRFCINSSITNFSDRRGEINDFKTAVVSNEQLGAFYDNLQIEGVRKGKQRADFIEAMIGKMLLESESEKQRIFIRNMVTEILVFTIERELSDKTLKEEDEEDKESDILRERKRFRGSCLIKNSRNEQIKMSDLKREVEKLLELSSNKALNFKTLRSYFKKSEINAFRYVTKENFQLLIEAFPETFEYSGRNERGIKLI